MIWFFILAKLEKKSLCRNSTDKITMFPDKITMFPDKITMFPDKI